jgi:hypothetical protein
VIKEGTLGAGWHHYYEATSDIALSGSRVGRVTDAEGWVKDGDEDEPNAGWVYELGPTVTSVELSGRRIAFIQNDHIKIKEGDLHAGWQPNFSTASVTQIALSHYRNASGQLVGRVGLLKTNGEFWVKEGALDSPDWRLQATGVWIIAMADDRIGCVKTSGEVWVKEGAVDRVWTKRVAFGVVALELGGSGSNKRIGVIKVDSTAWAKEPAIGSGWQQLDPGGNVSKLSLNSARIGVVTSGGVVKVMEGSVDCSDCPWITETSGSDVRLN